MSLREKLVAAVVLLTALSLAGVGLFVGLHLRAWSHEVLDRKLSTRAGELARRLTVEPDGELDTEADHELFEPHHGPPFRVEDARGRVLYETPIAWPPLERDRSGEPYSVDTPDGRAFRVIRKDAPPLVIHVVVDEQPYHELADRLLRGLLVALVGATLAGALGAWVVARATLRPVAELARAVDSVEPGKLEAALPRGEKDPELSRLVHAFDGMLARVRAAFERERAFTARASHALRTPLATLRAELEVALRRERPAEEYAAALREALATTVEASTLADGLLTLARAEGESTPPVSVDLTAATAGLRALIEPRARAELRPMRWEVPEGLSVRADPAALTELLAALLDNALRYGRGAVGLTAHAEGGSVRLEVWDEGPGLSAEDLLSVGERFFRGSAARTTGAAGSGLGLATARALAERFGGALELQPRAPAGLRVVVRLPRA